MRWETKRIRLIRSTVGINAEAFLLRRYQSQKRRQDTTKKQWTNSTTGIGQGSRIVNVDKLQQYTNDVTEHTTHCGGSIKLMGESRGLASTFTGELCVCVTGGGAEGGL